MPVPLPGHSEADLSLPARAETEQLAQGVRSAVGGADSLTPLQSLVLSAVFASMTGHTVDVGAASHVDVAVLAHRLAHRDAAFRGRIVQIMLVGALILPPIPA